MKQSTTNRLRKLLMLATAIALLCICFSGCLGGDPDETIDNLDALSTQGTEQTDAPTDPPVEETEEPTEEPTESAPESVMGTVNTDNLNVRKEPSMDGELIKQLAAGTRVEILEQQTNGDTVWGRIADGWVSMNYVTIDGEEPEPTEANISSGDSGSGTKGTITANSLNIRKGAGSKYDSIGKYSKGDVVVVLEKSGNWGRTDKGWISLKYVDLEGTVPEATEASKSEDDDNKSEDDDKQTTSADIVSDGNTKALGTKIISADALNVRSGPGTDYDKVDKVYAGERVSYYQTSGSWIRIKAGWISSSSSYVYTEGEKGEGAGSGTITASVLNVRSGPGTGFSSIGSLKEGDKVEILAQITVDDTKWGYTKDGWVCMDYVKMA